jgi:hypothetical protein
MNEDRITGSPSWSDPRGQVMKTPDDVAEMLRLKACGWGLKRIAGQLGCSHHRVKAYVAAGGVKPFKSPERRKLLDGLRVGCARGSFGIAAMGMSCARTCWPRKAWRPAGEHYNARCSPIVRR